MDIVASIQNSTQCPPNGGDKSEGFGNNAETLEGATIIFLNHVISKVEQKYKTLLEAKDHEISQQKERIDKLNKRINELQAQPAISQGDNIISQNSVAPTIHEYYFDYVLFPKGNPDTIIDCVIELANRKRELGKYVINSKTDWYAVCKVLHYFGVFKGDEMDFLNNILPNVLQYIEDPARREKLSTKPKNFTTIKKDNPMVTIPVEGWRRAANKERERMEEEKNNGERRNNAETVLNRCVNIKAYLCNILINHDVQLENY